MDVKIRIAVADDIESILFLNQKLCKKEHKFFDKTTNENYPSTERGRKYFVERINNGNAFVATIDGKIIGYLVGSLIPPEEYRNISNFAELENMLVLEEYRGKSIGKKLMDTFVEWCKSQKVKRIKVYASFKNKKAIDFYIREGFGEYALILEKDV